MKKKFWLTTIVVTFCLCLAGAAHAYQINFYSSTNNVYVYCENDGSWDEDSDLQFGTAANATMSIPSSPYDPPIAIAQAMASPMNTGPVAQVDLEINELIYDYSYHSNAHGQADTTGFFIIRKEAGDTADKVLVNFNFHVTGTFDLDDLGFSYSTYSYNLYVDDLEIYSVPLAGTSSPPNPPPLDDLFTTELLLEVGVGHYYQIVLDGELNRYAGSYAPLSTVHYQADLDVQVVPLPASILLLGSGLLGLLALGGRKSE